MTSAAEELLTPEERTTYLLYFRTPGLSLREIAAKIGKSRSQTGRIKDEAERKVRAMKSLCDKAGGDPEVVDQQLYHAESKSPHGTAD